MSLNQLLKYTLLSARQEGCVSLHPIFYRKSDIFLLAFSVVNFSSLKNIKAKWVPEVKSFCPKTQFALLGLKHDRRGAVESREGDEIEIPVEMALQVARDIGNIVIIIGVHVHVSLACLILQEYINYYCLYRTAHS